MEQHFTKKKIAAFVVLRLLIGWHFLYEGVVKLHNPAWTAKAYLLNASGPFKTFFGWLASDSLLAFVDFMNVFGLIAIGLGLILGIREQWVSIAGIVLLLFYYVSQPPFQGSSQLAVEGNYFFVNKNLIEAATLWVLYYFPTGQYLGLGILYRKSLSAQIPLNETS